MSRVFAPPVVHFYLSAEGECAYLPGERERKVFASLDEMAEPQRVFDRLALEGFRRSQTTIYRPTCAACRKCLSARVVTARFTLRKRHRQTLSRNRDLVAHWTLNQATHEQFALFRGYLSARHQSGGMDDMSMDEYARMVEASPVDTRLCEYRDGSGKLLACALADFLPDGRSLVYSFYDPTDPRRSLGSFIILDQIRQLQAENRPHLYLGYWIEGSQKMAYKSDYQPLEVLTDQGWEDQMRVQREGSPAGPALLKGDSHG
jgi:leucyl-tRNA---protein transferase